MGNIRDQKNRIMGKVKRGAASASLTQMGSTQQNQAPLPGTQEYVEAHRKPKPRPKKKGCGCAGKRRGG